VISTPEKVIVFLGYTFSGRHHDYKMLEAELSPEPDWFVDLSVRVDLGYLGIQTDYTGEQIERPHKKPRKSKQQPDTCLTEAQKNNSNVSTVNCWSNIQHPQLTQYLMIWPTQASDLLQIHRRSTTLLKDDVTRLAQSYTVAVPYDVATGSAQGQCGF
jgi:hypothetical protein